MKAPRNPVREARRKTELRNRLGGGAASCIICGYSELTGLLPAPHGLLEAHHVFGRNHDPDATVAVCRNCHAELTDRQRNAEVALRKQAEPRKRVAAMLRSLAVLFEMLAPALYKLAAALEGEKP